MFYSKYKETEQASRALFVFFVCFWAKQLRISQWKQNNFNSSIMCILAHTGEE